MTDKHVRARHTRPMIAAFILLVTCAVTRPLSAQEESPVVPPPSPIPLERVEVQVIEFEGNTALTDETLRQVAPVKPGTTINPTLLTEAIRAIEGAYTERGYIAEVTQVRIVGEQPPRTLIFDICETVVSQIIIEGLKNTRESAIRRLMDLEEGDLFNRRILQADIDRINTLGIFESIEVRLEAGDELGQEVVVWSVEERKTGEINFGGSLTPEGSLVGEVQYTQANLFGRAQRLSALVNVQTLGGKVGGQLAYYNPFIASPRTDLLVWAFSDVNFRFSGDLAHEPGVIRYSERRTGFQTIAGRRLDDFHSASVGLRYENVTTSGLPLESFTIADAGTGGTVIISSARHVEDRRLFLLLPASGNYLNGSLEAGTADRGDSSGGIAKIYAERNWYVPLQRITPDMLADENPRPVRTLAIRLSAGTSLGKLPFFEQFFLGGVNNLRGYREERFWGTSTVALTTEYRQPLSRQLVGVAFVDVGDAWSSDFQFVPGAVTAFRQHEGFSPRAGAGVGILWVTDFGALRFDVAHGEETRLHFAFGESF